mmetsp:Transcript_3983/g.16230  ORF Transcript_3983/g.16230 Transcript_3983/m.16230 type:complete len:210 (+) Transcript_3983:491-1120(+)
MIRRARKRCNTNSRWRETRCSRGGSRLTTIWRGLFGMSTMSTRSARWRFQTTATHRAVTHRAVEGEAARALGAASPSPHTSPSPSPRRSSTIARRSPTTTTASTTPRSWRRNSGGRSPRTTGTETVRWRAASSGSPCPKPGCSTPTTSLKKSGRRSLTESRAWTLTTLRGSSRSTTSSRPLPRSAREGTTRPNCERTSCRVLYKESRVK